MLRHGCVLGLARLIQSGRLRARESIFRMGMDIVYSAATNAGLRSTKELARIGRFHKYGVRSPTGVSLIDTFMKNGIVEFASTVNTT